MIKKNLSGDGLRARSLRTTLLAVADLGGQNVLRLLSNLVLTRILFPEAFGLMALVQVVITGLRMFSDTGIRQSIIQNSRGDDPDFLDTAWTMQIVRGGLLWLFCCALAWPASELYNEPMLLWVLPAAGLSLFIAGFMTTKVITANRHLAIGQQTINGLGVKTVEIAITVAVAFWLQSVWALVIGNLVGISLALVVHHVFLPGHNNRLRWDPEIARDLFNFGKFIFLSTAMTFIVRQGDKAILGGYISLAELGVYNIGYFLGSISLMLYQSISGRVVFPYYRIKPIQQSAENKRKVFFVRRLVIFGGLMGCFAMALSGIWLVDMLYDPRYALAGPVVVLISFSLVPQIVLSSYGAIFMSAGDSRQVFYLSASTALVQLALMFIGVQWFGIFGVVVSSGLALFITYPLRIQAVRRHNAWDPLADLVLLGGGLLLNGAAVWWHWEEVRMLM